MPVKRILGFCLLCLMCLSTMAGVYRGILTVEDQDKTEKNVVTLILENEGGFTSGWLEVGDIRQARIYEKPKEPLNILWNDGSLTSLRVDREDGMLLGNWAPGAVAPPALIRFEVQRRARLMEKMLPSIIHPFLSGLDAKIEAFEEASNHRAYFELSRSLARAFPMGHHFAGFAAALARRAGEKSASVTWHREAARRPYASDAKKELAEYHGEMTKLYKLCPNAWTHHHQNESATHVEGKDHWAHLEHKFERVEELHKAGSVDDALALAEESLRIVQERLDDDHPITLTTIDRLAALYRFMGRVDQALPLYQRGLALCQRLLGESHPLTLAWRDNLAAQYEAIGRYDEALPILQTTLEFCERIVVEPSELGGIASLANLYKSTGDYERAHPGLKQFLGVIGSSYSDVHPASLYQSIGRSKEVLPLMQRMIRIWGDSDYNLESLEASMREIEATYPLLLDALTETNPHLQKERKINEPVLAENHLYTLANHHPLMLRYASARRDNLIISVSRRALEKSGHVHRENLPLGATNHHEQAMSYALKGDTRQALKHLSVAIRKKSVKHLAWDYPVRWEVLEWDAPFRRVFLSLFMDHGGERTGEGILFLALNREGLLRRIAMATNRVARTSTDPVLQETLAFYRKKQRELASLILRPPEETGSSTYKKQLGDHDSSLAGLWGRMQLSISGFRPEQDVLNTATIRQNLPPDSILVNFFAFDKLHMAKAKIEYKGPHLIAVIVNPDGEHIPTIPLGPLDSMTDKIEAWRQAVINCGHPNEIEVLGRALHEQIWQPLTPYLTGKKTVHVVADGPLFRIPLGILPGPDGTRFDEHHDLIFMDAVYDLLSPSVPRADGNPLICYAPDFGGKTGPGFSGPELQASGRSRVDLHFTQLPGARIEGGQVTRLFEKAGYQPRELTGAAATETTLADLIAEKAPSVLHIASHGFFLDALPRPHAETGKEAFRNEGSPRTHNTVADLQSWTPPVHQPGDALFRSGIAMAGANRNTASDDGDDGLLTAYEAESLNLYGTRLVVLSACETGLGGLREGEGIYGLRRAFFIINC